MHWISTKFVPRLLTSEHKHQCVFFCQELLGEVRYDQKFLSSIITGDKPWLYCYNLQTKQQFSQWKSPSSPYPKKVRQVTSNIRSVFVIFFDCESIVHQGLSPPGHYYWEVLQCLIVQVHRKHL
jgi:hypothetical protein